MQSQFTEDKNMDNELQLYNFYCNSVSAIYLQKKWSKNKLDLLFCDRQTAPVEINNGGYIWIVCM